MTMLFGRPEETELSVPRTRLDETCPRCGGGDVEGYTMLDLRGWCLVARCPGCLHVLRREPSPTPFGFTYVPFSAHLRGAGG
ncbi:hypothetical protein Psed_2456 [Pseudonocardia dioxanivorans CB1190]|uniref:Uncharacterized protein n=1 Tax=Pseudonocardia dioxanivorans (strain ATCC 55486 / DSM 44775 / JCM 13855 / CB1190) TaxID=675635 RepID=F4CX29_PSEUX|nr:hypothetical protein [Pseudonocardia dioxanivorans]AEA24660.1 hypothetical protein Psed_2456 [Pseudonocardia dioxanivorans CB1190]